MLAEDLQTDLSFAENIVETVREPLLILDQQLHVIKANEAFYRTFQVSPDETLDRFFYQLGNGQWDIPALRELLETILPENSRFDDFEVEHTFQSIGRRTMLVNARRVVHGGEKILLAIEDITQRKQAEAAKIFLASVIEFSQDGIVTVDLDGIITTWNKGAERIYGYSAAEVLGKSLEILSTPEETIPLHTYFEKIRLGAPVKQVEIERVTKEGKRLWLSVQFSPIKDCTGKIIGVSTISRNITERHEASVALTKSEEILRKAISGKTVGVLFFNLSGGIVDANETFTRMCGYTREELRSSAHWKMLTAPDFFEPTFRTAGNIATKGETPPYEKKMIHKDGSHWWGLFAPVVLNFRGQDSDCMEFVIDITERKRAEEQLRLQRGLLETIVKFLPAGVALIRGSDLSFQMVNPRYQAISPERQMVGRTISEVWPEAMPHFAQRCRHVLETGEPFDILDERYDLQRETAGPLETAYFSWSVRKVDLPEAAEPGLLITLWETTARKNVELALRESSERYRALFDSIDEGFCVIEVLFKDGIPYDYRFLEVNPAFERHTGLKSAEGKTMREMLLKHDTHWFEIYGKVAMTGEPAHFERHVEAMNRWFHVSAFPIGPLEERKVALLFTDITESKKAQEILEQTVSDRTAALQEMNQQMETFTYTIAHDLRAPLRAQQGFARALVEEFGSTLGETGRDYAERIIASAARLNDLVNDLLTYSRIDRTALTFEKIDVRKVVEDICNEMAFEIHEAKAKIHMGELHFTVCGHESTFRTAVTNLISNAIKFSNPEIAPEVKIRAEEHGKNIRLWIEDNGIGIAPEHHHQIFGVFHRLHKIGEFPGTGVGLAIVQKGVERMGGHVGLESQEGQGSRFWIELEKVSDAQASRR